ncbi:MAG: branched-chain amino acid ABC transporter permease [Bradyrhizobiaceae bacterium]|nr:MAG: branched-chain amino acid ABC transporter permease [Bradyrhizobiaceae bacterium]
MTSVPVSTRVEGVVAGPSRFLVIPLVAVLFLGGGYLMHAESQWQIAGILALFTMAFVASEHTTIGRDIFKLVQRHGSLANCVALVCCLLLVWYFRREHYTLLMTATVAIYGMAAIGLTIQMAFAGVPNFAGAAFFVVGSYTAAICSAASVPSVVALLAGGAAAAILGGLLLLPVLRTKGHYAALVTISFGILLRTFLEVNDVLGGPQGMKIMSFRIFGVDFSRVKSIMGTPVSFYVPYVLLAIFLFALLFALCRRLEKSWIGVALDAVRCDETSASVFGISPARWKITAFCLGNAIIGLAGALYGMMNGFVNPNGAGLGDSLILLSIIILGGMGNIWGAVLASIIILVIPEKLQAIQEYRLLIFAVLVIAILRFRPSGLLGRQIRLFRNEAMPGGERHGA